MADEQFEGAKAVIARTMAEFGLESLGEWAWQKFLDGVPIEQIFLDMRDRPEYQARFPAIRELADKGRAMTEAEYIAYEKQATGFMRAAGLPEGFYDEPDDFAAFLRNEVSVNELQQRVQMAQSAVFASPPEVRDELERLYGVGQGALTAYFLDPDRAAPLIERQWSASQIAAQSRRAAFGQLAIPEAERLADLGVDAARAEQGFAQLAHDRELFGSLDRSEAEISRAAQLGATFESDAEAMTAIENRRRKRQAAFEDGGGFAGSGEGLSGVGATRT